MNLLSIDEVASKLKISKVSVKNWEKQGYIKALHNNMYLPDDIDKLMKKISSGEISRLKSRANKSKSVNKFIPLEYITSKDSIEALEIIVDFIIKYNIKPEQAIFLLAVNLFVKTGDIDEKTIYEAIKFENSSYFKRKSVFEDLKKWFFEISSGEISPDNKYCRFLIEATLPNEKDLLGIIYQSIINEGKKSALGSYYTPNILVEKIIENNDISGKVLDPCCGTGQFLLVMANKIENPSLIWGADIDNIAVHITRINLLLHYIQFDFEPNIFNVNSLLNWDEKGFSFIATNPPWGAKFEKNTLKELNSIYPEVQSKESFSYFLIFALKHLLDGGKYSFVLPESILFVKNHKDIRSHLLNHSTISLIESSGRMFKNVFSSVIRLEGCNTLSNVDSEVSVYVGDNNYKIDQNRFLSNSNNIIDIYCDNDDQNIIDLAYNVPHVTLKNRSLWALGIVTGNNELHISTEKEVGMEPLFRGKDIDSLILKEPKVFINFNPSLYQQCAPEELYRAEEKLIYKFISKDLCFAYDNNKHLTLNSANILIPQIDGIPGKVICALLNSSLYRFIFRKKNNAIKILRGDIESLPIPLFKIDQIEHITLLVDNYLENPNNLKSIDDYIFNYFGLNNELVEKILKFLKS